MDRMGQAGDYSVALTVALCILLAGCASKPTPQPSTAVQPEDHGIKIGERLSFHSKILNQDRPYWIYLPTLTKAGLRDQEVPGALPAGWRRNFHSAERGRAIHEHRPQANHQIPELIIVAIPNVARTRDLTADAHEEGLQWKR